MGGNCPGEVKVRGQLLGSSVKVNSIKYCNSREAAQRRNGSLAKWAWLSLSEFRGHVGGIFGV